MNRAEPFLLFSDLKGLFVQTLPALLIGALLFGGIGFWARSQVPVTHEICAAFKDGAKKRGAQEGGFESFLRTISTNQEGDGDVLLTSSLVLEPVVEQFGLQCFVAPQSMWKKRMALLANALRAERGKPLLPQTSFVFEDVTYRETLPAEYILLFPDRNTFEVRDRKKRLVATGVVGEEVVSKKFSFTLRSLPSSLSLNTSYFLTVAPLQEEVLALRDKIDVVENRANRGILELTLNHPDLKGGKQLLNAVMSSYQNHLIQEDRRIAEGQMAYLERRRDILSAKLKKDLQTHAHYLKDNIDANRALTLSDTLPFMQQRREKIIKELLAIELRKGKLEQGKGAFLSPEIAALQSSLRSMIKERDALSLALLRKPKKEQKTIDPLSLFHFWDSGERGAVSPLFSKCIQPPYRDKALSPLGPPLLEDWFPGGAELERVRAKKRELLTLIRKGKHPDLAMHYLTNALRLFSLREEALKKSLLSGSKKEEEHYGLDLTTAKTLLLDYLHKKDHLLSKYRQMEFGKKALEKEDIEYISLGEVFPDKVSQELVRELGSLAQQLRKERLFTEREGDRLAKKFASVKKDLTYHMKEVLALTLVEKERVEKMIQSVQLTVLDLIVEEITLLEREREDWIQEQKTLLQQEQQLLQGQLTCMRDELQAVPGSWLREKELQLNADLNQGILEALVQLVESKSIENHLSVIESKPVNWAYASFLPKSSLLKVFGFVGALIGALLTFVIYFSAALWRGFPIGLKNLALQGKRVLGTMGASHAKNLELFRGISLLTNQRKDHSQVVTLVLGKRYNPSLLCAELLAKEGKRVLLIDFAPLEGRGEKAPGELFSYLEEGKNRPLPCAKSFGDYIYGGGNYLYAQELLTRERFSIFLAEMKEVYDVVLISAEVGAKSSLPKYLFPHTDIMAVQLQGESHSQLAPYFAWEAKGHCLAFFA